MDLINASTHYEPTGDSLKVALAQIAPVWLDRAATLEKVVKAVEMAGKAEADLVTFGEALVPGYPFWVERTGGAAFDDPQQKRFYAHYLDQGVDIDRGDLSPLCATAAQYKIAVYVGIMERAGDRGGHSLYASLVYIDKEGAIKSVHRKLQPTFEERLVWGMGDGHGLKAHKLGAFTLGGLNCWENWLPLARAALYGQGVDLHVSVWPGGAHNTEHIARFIALESRSYVIAVSGLMRPQDIPSGSPLADAMKDGSEAAYFANGGSGLMDPQGKWVIAPVIDKEAIILADIHHGKVREERQTLDVAGHYARPDITELTINRRRLSTVHFNDD